MSYRVIKIRTEIGGGIAFVPMDLNDVELYLEGLKLSGWEIKDAEDVGFGAITLKKGSLESYKLSTGDTIYYYFGQGEVLL